MLTYHVTGLELYPNEVASESSGTRHCEDHVPGETRTFPSSRERCKVKALWVCVPFILGKSEAALLTVRYLSVLGRNEHEISRAGLSVGPQVSTPSLVQLQSGQDKQTLVQTIHRLW